LRKPISCVGVLETKRSMKILQVIPSYWPATQFGGTVFASQTLNKALARQGLDILVEAFARIAREKPDVHLLIAGGDEGGYRKKVEQWIRECGIENRVTFTGPLSGADRLRAYSGSDLFVLPSYSENFGMTVVEAMACGLPVVISDKVGICREVEDNKAGVVVQANAQGVYQGIRRFLDDDDARRVCAENGKRLVKERYDVSQVAEDMIGLYRSIVQPRT
jgi:glycosyltransferase involved in cell wall biosynthesis